VKLLKQLIAISARSRTSLKRGVNESGRELLSRSFRGAAFSRFVLLAAGIALIAAPSSVRACAACYGQSDSPLASGVTWGILSLLVVVMGVLGSIVTFFVYINKKSAAAAISAGPISDYPSPVTNH
jgi:hypothetical protein